MMMMTAPQTVKTLRSIFSTHGIPLRVVTDNGPQFVAKEFEDFCTANGVKHTLSAPYHPATNGEAERFVQTFKRNLKCRSTTSADVDKSICRFLITYRTTPHTATGMSPSYMLMGRRIRTRLDLLRPDFLGEQREKADNLRQTKGQVRTFQTGEEVLVRMYGTSKWAYGKVADREGELHYVVCTGGREVRRHVDQLRATEAEESLYPRANDNHESSFFPTTDNAADPRNSTPLQEMSVGVPASDPPMSPVVTVPPVPPGSPGPLGNSAGSPGRSVDALAEIPMKKLPPRSTRGKVPARYQDYSL